MSVDEQLFYLHCRGTSEKELKFTTGVMSGEFSTLPGSWWRFLQEGIPPLF